MRKQMIMLGVLVILAGAAPAAEPTGLMCELLAAPEQTKISDPKPEFGWIVNSAKKNDTQTAYRIVVSQGTDTLWDTQKVESGNSINIEYSGKALSPDSEYTWKVKTWTKLEGESDWSKPQSFRTATKLGEYVTTQYPLKESNVAPVSITKKGENHYFVDFGRVAFGYLTLTLDSPVATSLEVHLAERGTKDGVNKTPGGSVRYSKVIQPIPKGKQTVRVALPKDGRNTSGKAIKLPQQLGIVMPFRYVEIVNCPVELKSEMVTQVAVHYPFDEQAARFTSSDDILNQIWELCRYSMKATSFCGVYVDGDRERIPYEADAYINQLSHYGVDREYTLARYSHEYLMNNPTWPTEWLQHSVMMAWADLMATGNTESLAHCYDQLKKQKTLEQRAREDGLLNTKGMKDIVDWPKGEQDGFKFTPINTVVNAFHYENLKQMELFAKVLGKDEDAKLYATKARKFYEVFNQKLFDPKRGVYVDGEGVDHASLHANMIPLAFGLVPEDRIKTVADFVISKKMGCSVYGAQYLMEGLYNAGRQDAAFNLLVSKDIRSWYNMIRVGSTIALEAWDNKFKANQDWNHAWGAVPGNIIPRFLLGVRPLEPGFGKILVRPMPGPLEAVSSVIPTIRGPVEVVIENKAGKPFSLKLTLPVTVTARVEIPLPDDKSGVTVDGEVVTFKREKGFAVLHDIGSGTHLFQTTTAVTKRD